MEHGVDEPDAATDAFVGYGGASPEGFMGVLSRLRKRLKVISGAPQPVERPRVPSPTWEPEPEPESPRGDEDAAAFIGRFVGDNRVVLFMKGSPAEPKCGFSARASAILASHGAPFATFDVLIDPDVREGVKDFATWPTIPQVYIDGQFVGGSDILMQLHESGELADLLAAGS